MSTLDIPENEKAIFDLEPSKATCWDCANCQLAGQSHFCEVAIDNAWIRTSNAIQARTCVHFIKKEFKSILWGLIKWQTN